MKMIGIRSVEWSAISAAATSQPVTRGIIMSSKITSGRSAPTTMSASSPSAASRTRKPAASRLTRQSVRIEAWSSTTSTLLCVGEEVIWRRSLQRSRPATATILCGCAPRASVSHWLNAQNAVHRLRFIRHARARDQACAALLARLDAMVLCPNCGEENPEKFRLCGFCGTALAPTLPPQEVRKTVTIVFSDLKGSTAMAEKLDSEAVREVMSRYFDEMRGALELHGGTIEKYIGDAIMAVFGLPRVHEDDALRAVRAAVEMRDRLATLNEELDQRWGVTIGNRTGVNTGEVVAGDV